MGGMMPYKYKELKTYYHHGNYAYIRGFEKVPRNGMCACGSGLKYKLCCAKKKLNWFEKLMFYLFKID